MVIDASVALANALPDEQSAYAESIFDRLSDEPALVPTLWIYEIISALRLAEVRNRITPEFSNQVVAQLKELHIECEHPDGLRTLEVARQTGLPVYDASYVALCLQHQLPLASLDRRLLQAARDLGIVVLT